MDTDADAWLKVFYFSPQIPRKAKMPDNVKIQREPMFQVIITVPMKDMIWVEIKVYGYHLPMINVYGGQITGLKIRKSLV